MSLLDLAEQALGGTNATGGNSAVLSEVMSMIQRYPGGLGGIVGAFEQKGMGGAVNSWVGTGPNQPVSPQQVQTGLGNQAVQDVATRLGIPPGMAGGVLAQLLPAVVDHLTPNGQLPPQNANILEMGENLLKGLIK